MRRLSIALVLTASSAIAGSLAPVAVLAQDANPAQTYAQLSDAEVVRRVDAAIAQVAARPEAAGLSVAVARGDRIVVERGVGFANVQRKEKADATTVFRIGSLTKQFTAAAIMKLVEQGKIGLDDPLAKYLPEFDTGGRTVTIRQMLNHSSGIPSYTEQQAFNNDLATRAGTSRDQLLGLLKGVPFYFEPGKGWHYSNTNYFLLGMIIEKVSGRSYADFLQQELFRPVGLTHTYYDNGVGIAHGALGYSFDVPTDTLRPARVINMQWPFAAGALASTAGDLLRWQIALTGGRAVKPASFAQMIGSPVKMDRGESGYGFGLVVDKLIGQRHVWHNGGIDGFNSISSWFPDLGLRTAVISNSEALPSDAVEAFIIQALTTKDPLPPPRTTAQPGTEQALRAVLEGAIAGQPRYDLMSDRLAQIARQQEVQMKGLVASLGPLQSITFKGVDLNGIDQYLARFEKGTLLYELSLDPQGKIGGMFVRPVDPAR